MSNSKLDWLTRVYVPFFILIGLIFLACTGIDKVFPDNILAREIGLVATYALGGTVLLAYFKGYFTK